MEVPYGTILGPQITHFIKNINCHQILIADDSTVVARVKTLIEANTDAVKANCEMVKICR